MPRIIILDGNSLANRAFYALPMLTAADGRPTNVLHGFMTMLLRLLQEQNPDYWLVTFDKSKATVRIEQYAEYKAQRKETPDGLRPQFDYLKDVLAAFAVPMLELAGYEADDLIASVARKAEARGWEVLIYTGDRDALQLVSPKINVFLTKKGISEVECYDEHHLWERYQLRPAQIIDLKGLMGDSSDNIPGVPGVGEKTALKLLWEYGSVEDVLANKDKVSGKKVQGALEQYAEQALLSKRLATMMTEVPLEFALEDFVYRRPDEQEALAVLNKYSLRNIARLWQEKHGSGTLFDFDGNSPGDEVQAQEQAQVQPPEPARGQAVVTPWPKKNLTEQDWRGLFERWQREETPLTLAVRLEGGNTLTYKWQEWAIAVGTAEPGAAGAAESGVTESSSAELDSTVFAFTREQASPELVSAWFELLANPKVPKTVADSKSLRAAIAAERAAWAESAILKGLKLDLSLAAYLINPARTKFEPVELVRAYFPGQEPFADLYEEAQALAVVGPKYLSDLEKLGLTTLLSELEQPLSAVLVEMERHGIAVDTKTLREYGEELKNALTVLEQEIYELASGQFNINSTQQLGHILFEKLGLPPVKKTKTGFSTAAETLEELRPAHPIIEKILDYRQLSKLMSTYVNGLLAQVQEGRIHTTFQQTVTATGRLSSTEPNLQNIPIRLEYGRQLRKVFKPTEEDWLMLSADYSQIELRILAHYSNDPLLCESFALGQDVHTRTAAEVFGVPLAEVTSDLRRKAKAVNFGLVYGLTDFGLARDLGIPRKEAKYYIDQYFARYHGVKLYLEEVVKRAKEQGQVRTLLNRLRLIPEIHHPNRVQRQFGERIAMNSPVQGTAADIMKLAMLGVAAGLKGLRSKMLLQVHDELLLQVAPEELEQVAALVKEKMEQAYPLSVPLTVECKTGPNWYEMKRS
ncbi:DNA polymerase I [Paradesulfitobacterium aromaticivorans]